MSLIPEPPHGELPSPFPEHLKDPSLDPRRSIFSEEEALAAEHVSVYQMPPPPTEAEMAAPARGAIEAVFVSQVDHESSPIGSPEDTEVNDDVAKLDSSEAVTDQVTDSNEVSEETAPAPEVVADETTPNPEKPANLYHEFTTPSALSVHLITAERPSKIDWIAVAERAAQMGDAEGAGNLAVMALDRHMRSKQVAVPVVDSGELMQGARHVNQAVIELGGNISHLNRTEGNLDQTSNRLTRGGEAVAGNLSETAKLLETTVDRLAQILSPGNLASFNATVNILGRSINADTISRLDQTARMLSSAVAHMHNRSR